MFTASHILSDVLHDETVIVSHNYECKPGRYSMLTPSLSAFSTYCEGHDTSLAEGYYAVPTDIRRDLLAAMLRAVVGMERKEAYERGLVALPGDEMPATPTARTEGDAPEDEAEDVETRLPGCGRSTVTASVRGELPTIQFL